MNKLIAFAVLFFVTLSTDAQTSNKLCSEYRIDKPCRTVQKSPYRMGVKKPVVRAPTYIRSTGPSGKIDFSAPQFKIIGQSIYQIGPSGLIDYRNSFKIFGNRIYKLRPSGAPNFSRPSYLIQ